MKRAWKMDPATSSSRHASSERSPLLPRRPSSASTSSGDADQRPEGEARDASGKKLAPGSVVNAEELPDALTPEERRKKTLRWLAFWLVFGTVTIVLIVLAVKKGDAKFNFKDSLKKAAGGVGQLALHWSRSLC